MNIVSPLLGNHLVRQRVLAPEIVESHRVTAALHNIERRWPGTNETATDSHHPIFVLSAGWGSGSTLVQRLVMSAGRNLVWGEPFDEAAIIHRLASSLAAIRPGWPPEYHFNQPQNLGQLSQNWVANLSPPFIQLKQAHRAFMNTWLDNTNAASNAEHDVTAHWGLKEVRLTIDHARYLKWLYPNARFLFVYRDLHRCYLSCRRVSWTSVWPDHKVSPIVSFAHHWRYLLEGFYDGVDDVGGLLVRWEDLIEGSVDINNLENYLNIGKLDIGLLDVKVGGRSEHRRPLILPEKALLNAVAGGLRESLGYK